MNKKILAFTGRLGSGKDYTAMKHISKLKDNGNSIYMVSFADPIKQILFDSFNLTKTKSANPIILSKQGTMIDVTDFMYKLIYQVDNTIEYTKIVENYKKYEDEFYFHVENCVNDVNYDFSFRRLGQLLGTELGRYIRDSIWIDLAYHKIKKAFDANLCTYAIIADVRFLNEYQSLIDFEKETGIECKCYGIVATNETRAKRRGLTMEELVAQDQHGSEVEVDSIIAKLPANQIIDNN